jgi:hypothetical protein
LCRHCHEGQFPADAELDIENTEFSPGVRRMQALVGQQAPFEQGREQMKVLAGLEVTTKAVERVAETIGEDLASKERQEVQKAVQLDLPMVLGDSVPILYVQMDGTGVPVVKKEGTAAFAWKPGSLHGTFDCKVLAIPRRRRRAIRGGDLPSDALAGPGT